MEGRFWRPSAGRGVFGLSGERLLVPTLDLPVKSCRTVVRTSSKRKAVAEVDERLNVSCLIEGIMLDCLITADEFPQVLIDLDKEMPTSYSTDPQHVPDVPLRMP